MINKEIKLNHQNIISLMTLKEKASLLSGANFWNTKSIDRLGIPSIMLTDGPHGLRKQGGKADHLGLNKSILATCFPTAATLANSWDEHLLEEVGRCLGKEAAEEEVSVILGPGLNIKRNPLGGRNFEYFSEDPYLTGKLAAAMTRGIQEEGVSACPKHFAVNSQETRRMIIDEIVDDRALHELYLEGFRYVIKEGKPKTVMTSYNKVNGTFANENIELLKNVLIKDFGFDGVIVTDWGGNNDRIGGLLAGNTLEMPSTYGMTDLEVVDAVKGEIIFETLVDEQVDKILTLIESTLDRHGMFRPDDKKSGKEKEVAKKTPDKREMFQKHHKKAVEAAKRSIILLKNEDEILPLTDLDKKIAIIGDFAENPRYQGAGSSLIEPVSLISLNEALKETNLQITGYEKGYKRLGQESRSLRKKALELTRKTDIVLCFAGLDEGSEAEGVDRKHMRLAENQLRLIDEITSIHDHVIVILAGGAPVELPFEHKVKGILHGYLPGQGGGKAIADVLTGICNPSGKLAESYPMIYEDVISSFYYPGQGKTAQHRESIFIGYRHYDRVDKPVRYPFGHGLSYTTFEYSDLFVEHSKVFVKVKNTGQRKGEEIVQIYVEPKTRKVFNEKRALKGFRKVSLEPGEITEVQISLDEHAFSYYHIERKEWVIEEGEYEIHAASSSRDLRLKTVVQINESTIRNELKEKIIEAEDPYKKRNMDVYRSDGINELKEEDFEKLLGRKLPSDEFKYRMKLTKHDLIEQAKYGGFFGKMIYGLIKSVHYLLKWVGKPVKSNNVLFVLGMPFRSVARMSGGRVNMEMLDGLMNMVNGRFLTGSKQWMSAYMIKNRIEKRIGEEENEK